MLRGLFSVCAALGAAVVPSFPAFAGHYDVVYTYAVSASPGQPNGSGGFITSWAVAQNAISVTDRFNGTVPVSASASTSGTVTATFTWQRDPNIPNDDPPTTVWVSETASASWSGRTDGAQWHSQTGQQCPKDYAIVGNADNGLGGTYVPNDPSSGFGGTSSGPARLTRGGGASFTKDCTLSAAATGDGGRYWRGSVDVSVSYSANIFDGSAHASASFDLLPDADSTGWSAGIFVYGGPRPTDGTYSLGQGPGGPPGVYVHLEHTGLSADVTEITSQYYNYDVSSNNSGTRSPLYVSGTGNVTGDVSHKVFTASSSCFIDISPDVQISLSGSAPDENDLSYVQAATLQGVEINVSSPPYRVNVTLKAKASTK